jgi:tetratricopeptide (TPR) repeat protein
VYQEALDAYREVLRSGPENAFIAAEQAALAAALGIALADAGQERQAIEQLESALARLAALGPPDELNAEVRRQMERARQRLAELRRAAP